MSLSIAITRLFVYGTLRKMDPTGKISLLGKARYLGLGKVRGILFHLGEYPGAVSSFQEDEVVIGEVYELLDFTEQIQVLDVYEGCAVDAPIPQEYRREVTSVELENQEKTLAWIYWYQGKAGGLDRISSGDWLAEEPFGKGLKASKKQS